MITNRTVVKMDYSELNKEKEQIEPFDFDDYSDDYVEEKEDVPTKPFDFNAYSDDYVEVKKSVVQKLLIKIFIKYF